MKTARVLYAIARADFLERVRRYSFLLTLAGAVFLCYQVHLGNLGIRLGDKRGTMNSAWLGAVMTLVATFFLSLFGFYMVKNAVARDSQTGVGQILAATPLSRAQYVFGKALSHFTVLAFMVLLLALAAPPLQLLAGEDLRIDFGALLAPFIFVALPAMTLTAALAILFETARWLRGGAGNIAYIFIFNGLLVFVLHTGFADPTGMSLFKPGMMEARRAADPSYKDSFGFGAGPRRPQRGFEWKGVEWTPAHAAQSLIWPGISVGLCALAALCFHRFDTLTPRPLSAGAEPSSEAPPAVRASVRARHLPATARRPWFPFVFANELRLMLKGSPWWWYAGAAGAIIAGIVVPAKGLGYALAFAWIWPILLWSQMGGREGSCGTAQLVFTAPHPVRRQLPATWLAGVAVALAMGSGVAIRIILSADWAGLGAFAAGALLPPSLALCLGVWSGGSKAFEAVYTLAWYVGPASRLPTADFTFASGNAHLVPTYLAAIAALVALAFLGRGLKNIA